LESRISGPSTLLDVTYEDVRLSFAIRLHGEEARLSFLAGALQLTGPDTAAAFVDLEMFAHRLRGAAAVFDYPVLREEAKALELAAAAAAVKGSPVGEPSVQDTMRALALRLSAMNAATPSPGVSVMPAPAN
jgi:hypothetical protein